MRQVQFLEVDGEGLVELSEVGAEEVGRRREGTEMRADCVLRIVRERVL